MLKPMIRSLLCHDIGHQNDAGEGPRVASESCNKNTNRQVEARRDSCRSPAVLVDVFEKERMSTVSMPSQPHYLVLSGTQQDDFVLCRRRGVSIFRLWVREGETGGAIPSLDDPHRIREHRAMMRRRGLKHIGV